MNRPLSGRVPLIVPELGLGSMPVVVSLWLVPTGAAVLAGDRVLELVAGGVTIDLEAPISGRLSRQYGSGCSRPRISQRVVAQTKRT